MKRIEAANLGLTYYSTGKSCKHGHADKRYVSTGQCVECISQNAKRCRDLTVKIRDSRRGADVNLYARAVPPDLHAAMDAHLDALLAARKLMGS